MPADAAHGRTSDIRTEEQNGWLASASNAIFGSGERDQNHPASPASSSTAAASSAHPLYSTEVPAYPAPASKAPPPRKAMPASHQPERSVTISEGHLECRRGRRSVQISADEGTPRTSGQHRQSGSRARPSGDAGPRRSASGARRSISLSGLTRSTGAHPNPLKEPRRSIGKRPEEFDLRARDSRNGHKVFKREKDLVRDVPFAAPYAKSGVVLSSPASWSDFKVPGPLTLGHGQWWYLIAGQSIVAAVISGAINFAVGCATYNKYQPPTELRFWQWIPVPLAGDMGVTVIVQQIVSMIITSALVHHDLTDGPIGPLRRPWPPLMHLPSTPSPTGSWLGCRMSADVPDEKPLYMGKAEGQSKLKQYWWWLVRAFLMGSERNDILAKGISWRQRCERILWTAAQGFVLCLLTFPWFWPISIAIVAPIYEHRNLAGTWIPPIVKLLYGAIMGLLTNPIIALLAMGAESSVRRAYPELDIWQPFGGEADYQAWLAEQNIAGDEVEIGPNGLARTSNQFPRASREHNHSETASLEQGSDMEDAVDVQENARPSRRSSSGERRQAKRAARDRASVPPSRSGLAGGTAISQRITEERPSPRSPPRVAPAISPSNAAGNPPPTRPVPSRAMTAETMDSFVSAT